jgi:hypothetical protein
MKISTAAIILAATGLGLSLVYSQQSTSETQTKAQQILREKLAELKSGESLPGKSELLADVERLHNEGKISDEQYAKYKKNVNERYTSPGGPSDSEAQAKAQKALDQKLAELNAGNQTPPPPSNTEVQAKAQKVLEEKSTEQKSTAPHPETDTIAQQVLHQKVAQLRTEERTNLVPDKTTGTLTPELEAKGRELLRAEIAASRKGEYATPEPNPEAQAKALAILHQNEADLKAGVTTDTPEKTRILRLKIAESKGIITPAEAAQAAAAPALASAAPSTQSGEVGGIGAQQVRRFSSEPSPLPAFSSNKEGMARLQELTDQYKADKVTPYEYHHERAKIVASL